MTQKSDLALTKLHRQISKQPPIFLPNGKKWVAVRGFIWGRSGLIGVGHYRISDRLSSSL